MDFWRLGEELRWSDEAHRETRAQPEMHCISLRCDCLHLDENGGTCAPEHGGCSAECPFYQPRRGSVKIAEEMGD
jgi:hypothetical protein